MSLGVIFLICLVSQVLGDPTPPLWPIGFVAPNQIIAFDENSTAHVHDSILYYDAKLRGERHDHDGYCYGWGSDSCTILIIGNVYIVKSNLCCVALPATAAVPQNWLNGATWLGEEEVNGMRVNHWYSFEHEYWSLVDAPYTGVRYAGPNFDTPRQFTTYKSWQLGPQSPSLFQLPANVDCSQDCPDTVDLNLLKRFLNRE